MARCLTPGCKNRKKGSRLYRCFTCKEVRARKKALDYYHSHHNAQPPQKV